jgi:hypothetical protein
MRARAPHCRWPVGARAYAIAFEDAAETGQRGRPGLLERSSDGVAGVAPETVDPLSLSIIEYQDE